MVDDVRGELGPVTVLVCSAAARSLVDFFDLSREEWDRVLRTTLDGAYVLTRAVVADMRDAGFGRLLYLGGGASSIPRHVHVAAAKAGVEGMMRGLATELGPLGITANVVSPGGLDTDRRGTHTSEAIERLRTSIAESIARSPIRRLVGVDEVAS